MAMTPDQWRDLSRSQGGNVWSMLIQLLQFAASEYPEEFKRRRDGIAEALFSPELSGRGRPNSKKTSSRVRGASEAETPTASEEGLQHVGDFVPSGWAPLSTGSSVVEEGPDPGSTKGAPQRTQCSRASDGGASRANAPPLVAAEKPAARGSELKPAQGTCKVENNPRNPSPSKKGGPAVRLSQSFSAEARILPSVEQVTEERLEERGGHPSQEPASEIEQEKVNKLAFEPVQSEGTPAAVGGDNPGCSEPTFPWGLEGADTDTDRGLREASEGKEAEVDLAQDLADISDDDLACEDLARERVEAVKEALCREDAPLADLVLKLKELQHLPMSMDTLKASQIGKVVKALKGQQQDPELLGLCKKLIRDWKKLVDQSCSVQAAHEQEPAAPPGDAGASGLGSLPAPPMDDNVLQLSAELSNGLGVSDFDSLESELSGSVGSAGGQCQLATKTPESHRVFPSSESSPCETNRPLAYQACARPQSVLSSSVRKAGWTECEGGPDAKDEEYVPAVIAVDAKVEEYVPAEIAIDASGLREQHQQHQYKQQQQQHMLPPTNSGAQARHSAKPMAAVPRPEPKPGAAGLPGPQAQARAQSGQGSGAANPRGMSLQGSRRDVMPNALRPVREPQPGAPDVFRPAPPRPVAPPQKIDRNEKERVELSKRRLQESYQMLGEAKKYKTIQVVSETEPKKTLKPKAGSARPHPLMARSLARPGR